MVKKSIFSASYIMIVIMTSVPVSMSTGLAESPKLNPHDRSNMHLFKNAVEDVPNVQIAVHSVGDVWMTVSNLGQFGTGYLGVSLDPVTGMESPSCMFPANSNLNYLYVGGFWVGAVVGRDTLVSVGIDDYYSVLEFWPKSTASIVRRSIQVSSPLYHPDAKSEQDIIAVYSDDLTDPAFVRNDFHDGRPHIPLGIEITQRSFAWSYAYAEDFILFDYSIRNNGYKQLQNVYMAVYVDGDVHHESNFGYQGYGEDLCGFKTTFSSDYGVCRYTDTINIAYITDNDGDPAGDPGNRQFNTNSVRGAAGIRVVRTPSDSLKYSFNWWFTNYGDPNDDFGPRKVGTQEDPFRDMLGVFGTPLGDKNKYYVMRHPEFDYDQMFTGKDHTAEGWLPRPPNAADFANGNDVRYLLSFGPFDISPGEVLPVSFAWVLGEGVHQNPNDYDEYYSLTEPEIYYNTWDFRDLAINSRWASWIYDNPGYDTDGDGYRGKFRICAIDSILQDSIIQEDPLIIDTYYVYSVADTIWYEGDRVPDFRGASPPPPPQLWIIDTGGDTLSSKISPSIDEFNHGEFRIRWNGLLSETTKDVFSNQIDFEGYKIYMALAPVPESFTLLATYDIEDYDKYIWINNRGIWELKDIPFTLDSLKKLYGSGFDPALYDIDHPFYWQDSAFYFRTRHHNQSDIYDKNLIHKVYPEEPYPTTLNIDSARIYYPEELTIDGLFFKYFEYEYCMRNLLPSQLYYIAVTAFDFGAPASGLGELETDPINNFVAEYPQSHSMIAEREGLNIIVYPNPYRADGRYAESGFEGRDYVDNEGKLISQSGLNDDRTRSIHFMNLPHECTIRIFSIDGDLIRIINHDVPPDHPQSGHERWDMITRNTQPVVSGIYYYSVESETGSWIGKIVIIM